MDIPKELNDKIFDYCRANSITNIDEFNLKLLKQGFTIECFGATPETKERIVEKIVEVEKVVERIVSDDIQTKQLCEDNAKLIKEIEELKKQIKELQTKRKDLYGE